jgi:hypothetical protein
MYLKKGNFQEDEHFFYFDVEASNENLDFEQQSVLQRALLGSKDYFLSNGVVSKDHLHKRIENCRQVTDEQYVIGEPVSVYTEGKSTRVKGRLYKNNKHAQKFIDLLRAGSTRVKASVGGIVPKVVKNLKEGTEKVVSVLWNDLALTIAPVNYTVSPAMGVMVKSLTSLEFVKSLSAGYGTDSSRFTGGRALQKEEVGNARYEEAILDLVHAFSNGVVKTVEDAKDFLKKYRFSTGVSLDIIREIASKHKEFVEVLPMTRKSGGLFSDIIENIRKSIGGGSMPSRSKKADKEPEEPEEPEENGDGEEEFIDAEEVIKALTDQVEEIGAGQERILKALENITSQFAQDAEFKKSMGEGMIALMENYQAIAKTPIPRKSIGPLEAMSIAKGNASGEKIKRHKQFNVEMKNKVTDILTKAVASGELDILKSGKIETQINKSLVDPSFQLDQEYQEFLFKKLSV